MRLQKLTRWVDAADAALARALGSDRDHIAESVNAGRVELWCVNGGELWLVTHVEEGGTDLVVCCVQGRGLMRVADAIYAIAQANGLSGIRFFTARRGLAKLLRRYRFSPMGTVYRCEVSPRVTQ